MAEFFVLFCFVCIYQVSTDKLMKTRTWALIQSPPRHPIHCRQVIIIASADVSCSVRTHRVVEADTHSTPDTPSVLLHNPTQETRKQPWSLHI